MDQDTYDRFKDLRQSYYLAGRNLLINQLFGMAGINLGYCIELSLKFIKAFKGCPELRKHEVERYYNEVIATGDIPSLAVSRDFLRFVTERLNARYPKHIATNAKRHELESRAHVFPVDMLHCYDDFILQLDDAIVNFTRDPRVSIGFRSCRDVRSVKGRIFFHCNDHAFSRISEYRQSLANNRDSADDFEHIDSILAQPHQLWNFKGLMAYRPWGPRIWSPASEFSFPKIENGEVCARAAKWAANSADIDMYISSMELLLPAGTYESQIKDVVVSKDGATE